MRETKTITTKSGISVEVHSYVTGRDRKVINEALLTGAQLTEGEAPKIDGLAISRAQEAALKALVVSLNGSRDNVYENLLDLRDSEYNEVVEAVNAVTANAKDFPQGDSKS